MISRSPYCATPQPITSSLAAHVGQTPCTKALATPRKPSATSTVSTCILGGKCSSTSSFATFLHETELCTRTSSHRSLTPLCRVAQGTPLTQSGQTLLTSQPFPF